MVNSDLQTRQQVEAKIIDASSFSEFLTNSKIIFFGDGAHKCREVITHVNASFVDNISPQSAVLGEMAFQKFQKQEFEDLMQFEPLYLKEFMIKKANSTV